MLLSLFESRSGPAGWQLGRPTEHDARLPCQDVAAHQPGELCVVEGTNDGPIARERLGLDGHTATKPAFKRYIGVTVSLTWEA